MSAESVPSLRSLCIRANALALFRTIERKNIRFDDPPDAEGDEKETSKPRRLRELTAQFSRMTYTMPLELRQPMRTALKRVVDELSRWSRKHGELFTLRKANRTQHLQLYIDCVTWSPETILIDDATTARKIVDANENWAQLQFNFACAYVFEDVLEKFDKIQLRVFRARLADHPLYDLWHEILNKETPKNPSENNIFEYVGLTPREVVVDAFRWALQFGYAELIRYIWKQVEAPSQREFLGMLQWRQLCSKDTVYEPTFKFLAQELFDVNPMTTARVTAQIFACKVRRIVDDFQAGKGRVKYRPRYLDNGGEDRYGPIRYLLDFIPAELRRQLLAFEGYHVFMLTAMHKDLETFRFLAGHLVDRTQRKALCTRILDELSPAKQSEATTGHKLARSVSTPVTTNNLPPKALDTFLAIVMND